MPPTTHWSRTGAAIGTLLQLTMMIIDDQGDAVGTLEQLFQGVRGLVDDNARLRKEVESLSTGVTTQGMNILDGLGLEFLNRGVITVQWDSNWSRGLDVCVLAREKNLKGNICFWLTNECWKTFSENYGKS